MKYWEVILDALLDTAKILPFLFIVYYLIELLEFKCAVKMQNSKFLKGKTSPVFGSLLGCIPQCGFSVISTDLFSRGVVGVGALVAVFIATSDEAIPLMISNPKSVVWMLLLVGIKIVFGIMIGYLAVALHKFIFKKSEIVKLNETEHDHEEVVHGGCCHHHVESKSFDWLHPMLHCLKISLFILCVNLLFGFITQIWVGEAKLTEFLTASVYLQPLLAVMIGLIPNCVSSVVITELFLVGGLKFGALVAGLCVNAGLGMLVLLKQNKNWKENLFIILITIIPSLLLGYALLFI